MTAAAKLYPRTQSLGGLIPFAMCQEMLEVSHCLLHGRWKVIRYAFHQAPLLDEKLCSLWTGVASAVRKPLFISHAMITNIGIVSLVMLIAKAVLHHF